MCLITVVAQPFHDSRAKATVAYAILYGDNALETLAYLMK